MQNQAGMTDQENLFVAAAAAKLDQALAKDLRRIRKTGHMTWRKAETFIAHGLIFGSMQNYQLTEKGMAELLRIEG